MSDATIMTTGGQSVAQPGLPALAGRLPGGGADGMRLKMTGLLSQPAVQRSLPMIGLLALVALAGLAWFALREPPQRDLFRGLPEADQAAVADVLTKSSIAYGFDRTSGAITVAEDDYFKAKMKLAAEGLPKSAPDGDTLLSAMPMGASRAVEGEKLRTAREMDLARTIEAIDAVTRARVHLAVEPPSLFLRERSRPTASVMLQLVNGRALTEGQVEAIVHLVASSVADMAPEAVSVVDQNGRLLSQTTGAGAETDRQIQIQARIEERYRQAVTALLTPIVGVGKFSTEVHAEVNFAERQATRETYPQDEARLRVETGSWNSDAQGEAGATAGGIPGALQPNPPVNPAAPGGPPPTLDAAAQAGAATAEPAMPPFKTAETFNRSFELGREVSVTRDAVGTVQRLSIAVALDEGADGKPRSAQEIAALEALVKGAIGFDQARGDVVALSSRKFVQMAESETVAPWYEKSWVGMLARNLSAVLVALILLLGIGRPLLKRWSAAKGAAGLDPEQSRQLGEEIKTELGRAATHDPGRPVTIDMISATPDYSDRATLIRNFVKQDPDRAALVVRDLLKDGVKADG
ncbi:MAG TPA: flagellar basal-body MS-ring/collar protein FliF [Sphingobium sp.]|nr:flagellar basal-body MS-ring/collar protein FliF [Sphingobium sp.]